MVTCWCQVTDVVLGRAHPGKPWLVFFLLSVFLYPDIDPIYVVLTFLLTDDFTEWAVYLRNSGKVFVADFNVSMCGDNVFSSDWQMRWSLAPRGAPLFAFPLFHHHLLPFLQPPLLACSYLSAVKDFDRKGNPTLGMGQRWRREQEPSGACVHAALQSERPSTHCAIGSLSDMLAGCLASVTDGNIANILILHQQKKKLTPHRGAHQKWHFVNTAIQPRTIKN